MPIDVRRRENLTRKATSACCNEHMLTGKETGGQGGGWARRWADKEMGRWGGGRTGRWVGGVEGRVEAEHEHASFL
jgi:hypothetical protein